MCFVFQLEINDVFVTCSFVLTCLHSFYLKGVGLIYDNVAEEILSSTLVDSVPFEALTQRFSSPCVNVTMKLGALDNYRTTLALLLVLLQWFSPFHFATVENFLQNRITESE